VLDVHPAEKPAAAVIGDGDEMARVRQQSTERGPHLVDRDRVAELTGQTRHLNGVRQLRSTNV
jgi:hypothetical protein